MILGMPFCAHVPFKKKKVMESLLSIKKLQWKAFSSSLRVVDNSLQDQRFSTYSPSYQTTTNPVLISLNPPWLQFQFFHWWNAFRSLPPVTEFQTQHIGSIQASVEVKCAPRTMCVHPWSLFHHSPPGKLCSRTRQFLLRGQNRHSTREETHSLMRLTVLKLRQKIAWLLRKI